MTTSALGAVIAGIAAFVTFLAFARTTAVRPGPVVAVAVGAAVVAAVPLEAAPTGSDGIDLVWRVVFVGVVVLAAARAGRGALVVAATLAAATTSTTGAAPAIAFAALGGSVALARTRRDPALGACVGALLAHALLDLGWPDGQGATAAVAGLAAAIVVVSVVWSLPRRARRLTLAAVAIVVAGGIALGAVAGSSLRARRAEALAAVDEATAGIEAAQRGDTEQAGRRLRAAATSLRRLEEDTHAWWVAPARALPVAAQHLRAAEVLLDGAAAVADAGADTADDVDLDRVRPQGGRVDLAALASFDEPLAAAGATIEQSVRRVQRIRSPWLLDPVDERIDEFGEQADEAAHDLATARESLAWVRRLLGAERPQRWFLAAITPSELTYGGGFIGSWAVLTAEDGRLTLSEPAPAKELIDPDDPPTITVSPAFDAWYPQRFGLTEFPQNLMVSPDFPSNADAIADVAEHDGHGRVDGVIAIDPIAIAALVEVSGPIEVDWLDEPLTGANTARVLLYEQYLRAQDPDRRDFIDDVVGLLFDRLSGGLASPEQLGRALSPMVRQGHIQARSFDAENQAFIDAHGGRQRLEPPAPDGLAVVANDITPSKLDWFLRRSITYDLEVDPDTGEASGTVTVEHRNEASDDLPGNYFGGPIREGGRGVGVNHLTSVVHTALPVVAATLDGQPIGTATYAELGYHATEVALVLQPGQTKVLRFDVAGRFPDVGRFRIAVHRQPVVEPDHVRVIVNGKVRLDGPLTEDRNLAIPLG